MKSSSSKSLSDRLIAAAMEVFQRDGIDTADAERLAQQLPEAALDIVERLTANQKLMPCAWCGFDAVVYWGYPSTWATDLVEYWRCTNPVCPCRSIASRVDPPTPAAKLTDLVARIRTSQLYTYRAPDLNTMHEQHIKSALGFKTVRLAQLKKAR